MAVNANQAIGTLTAPLSGRDEPISRVMTPVLATLTMGKFLPELGEEPSILRGRASENGCNGTLFYATFADKLRLFLVDTQQIP